MSRKTRRNRTNPEQHEPGASGAPGTGWSSRKGIVVGVVVVLVLALAAAVILYRGDQTQSSGVVTADRDAALASEHSPTLGDPAAKVHVVEFLDPACETCAMFYPLVKGWMAEQPGRIRLSVRHVAFHKGSDYVVRILEASRKQDRYWQTLEALLASQHQWVPNHTVLPDSVLPAIAGVGLDVERLMADMNAAEVTQRMQRDRNDAMVLKVAATPEYFVNGRPMPSFGQQQLATLVREELQKAY